MLIKPILHYLSSILSFKGGSGFLISSVVSTSFIYSITQKLFPLDLHLDLDTKSVALFFAIQAWGFTFYGIFVVLDFFTGLQASKYEYVNLPPPKPKGYIKVHLLYNTLWKTLGILFVTFMIAILGIILQLMQYANFSLFCMWFLITFWLLSNGYEFYSIGDNIERRYGKKPPIFSFWDRILQAIQDKFIKKIEGIPTDFKKNG